MNDADRIANNADPDQTSLEQPGLGSTWFAHT